MVKAVIPVAGAGKKLRPHTHTQPKPLIPVAGKPILGHIIESLLDAGIKDFIFVIGYLGEKIEEFVREGYADKANIEFVVQTPREGLGHAIWMAREEIQQADEILIALGDTIVDADLGQIIASEHSIVGVQTVEDPRHFGVAVVDESGFVSSVAEKPLIPKSNLALVGLYKICEPKLLMEILDTTIREGNPGNNGEFQLTDALATLIEKEVKIRTLAVDNWFDCGKKETLLETNRLLLEKVTQIDQSHFRNCVIRPPVFIPKDCVIEDSIIGPYVAIADHVVIRNSIVKDSILGTYSQLESIILDGSVVGSDASLKGAGYSINIGDNTEIDFSS